MGIVLLLAQDKFELRVFRIDVTKSGLEEYEEAVLEEVVELDGC